MRFINSLQAVIGSFQFQAIAGFLDDIGLEYDYDYQVKKGSQLQIWFFPPEYNQDSAPICIRCIRDQNQVAVFGSPEHQSVMFAGEHHDVPVANSRMRILTITLEDPNSLQDLERILKEYWP